MAEAEMFTAARRLIENGDFSKAVSILLPLAHKNSPEALFLLSTVSLSGEESDEDFERRSVEYLARAAHLGYAPAMCALGVCYDSGDLVEADTEKAATLFEQAAEAGDAHGMYFHGRNLYYKAGDDLARRMLARQYLKRAVAAGVDDAADFLQQIDGPADLSAYNLDALKRLYDQVQKAMGDRQERDVAAARAQILTIAREIGLSMRDLHNIEIEKARWSRSGNLIRDSAKRRKRLVASASSVPSTKKVVDTS